jgi:hypothetical protein
MQKRTIPRSSVRLFTSSAGLLRALSGLGGLSRSGKGITPRKVTEYGNWLNITFLGAR